VFQLQIATGPWSVALTLTKAAVNMSDGPGKSPLPLRYASKFFRIFDLSKANLTTA
jgi:hypothetical protein